MNMNVAIEFLMENATTYRERRDIETLTESEMAQVNNTLVTNLYKSAIDKSHVDFEDIPNSKGDLTKYKGYQQTIQVIDLLEKLSVQQGVSVPELMVVKDAINNIIRYRDSFEKGFRLDKEFITMQYNTLVFAVVEATSLIIANYVDFVKRVDQNDFQITRNPRSQSALVIDSLVKFNMSVKRGDFSKALQAVIATGKENFAGSTVILTAVGISMAVASIVPVTRELIFGFYYTRMKLSDHLKHQAELLEINRQSVEASNRPAKERNAIVKNQTTKIRQLQALSDKIKVQHQIGETQARKEMGKENRGWSIDSVRSQSASTDSTGFSLL